MSRDAVFLFANTLLKDSGAQRDLQTAVNDFASGLVDVGSKRGFDFSVEEIGEFLTATFFPDGSTPDNPAADRRQWAPIIQKMLTELRVSNPDHQMFQTMAFDSLDDDGDLKALLEQAKQTQKAAAPAPVAKAPAEPQVDAFEPEDSYFDAQSSTEKELEEAKRRLAEMESQQEAAAANKPFWKVW